MLEPVHWSSEFDRIWRLPRRQVPAPATQERSTRDLTPLLTTPRGRERGVQLKPIQAWAIEEVLLNKGLFGAISTGRGKTLISWLLPSIVDAKRPLLVLPAKLVKEKTPKEFTELKKYWVSPSFSYRIESYTKLSRIESADLLPRFQPDLIVCDEVHKLRNQDTAAVQRIGRYIKEARKEGRHITFVALTATILRKSLRDFAHLLDWALGDQAPIPRTWSVLDDWCRALDENVDFFQRKTPGVLKQFVEPVDQFEGSKKVDELTAVRKAFRRRLQDTPGVICDDEGSCDQNLYINFFKAPDDQVLDAAFEKFRTLWETPDGWPLSDPLSVYRHAFELSCCFYYYWDPRPPASWIDARRSWCAFVRDKIKSSRHTPRPLDTELAVARAYPDAPEHADWKRIRPTFKPHTVARWLSNSVLNFAGIWEAERKPGLIWVQHKECGQALAKVLRLRYYGAGGLDENGFSIENAPRDRSAIVSTHSNNEGRNLQAWARNLIICTPQAATHWEQLLSRTHRDGQAREVIADVLLSCRENLNAIDRAVAEAQFVQQTQGQRNKLLLATYSQIPNLGSSPRYWQKDLTP